MTPFKLEDGARSFDLTEESPLGMVMMSTAIAFSLIVSEALPFSCSATCQGHVAIRAELNKFAQRLLPFVLFSRTWIGNNISSLPGIFLRRRWRKRRASSAWRVID